MPVPASSEFSAACAVNAFEEERIQICDRTAVRGLASAKLFANIEHRPWLYERISNP